MTKNTEGASRERRILVARRTFSGSSSFPVSSASDRDCLASLAFITASTTAFGMESALNANASGAPSSQIVVCFCATWRDAAAAQTAGQSTKHEAQWLDFMMVRCALIVFSSSSTRNRFMISSLPTAWLLETESDRQFRNALFTESSMYFHLLMES